MTDLFRAKFIVEMEAEGNRFEVSRFVSDFGVNDIPVATCILAIGRNAADGRTEAKIHKNLDSLKEFVDAKVFFTADGEWSRKYDWPKGEHLIFEGKIHGIGFQKVRGKVYLVAHLQHWLADLNYSSSVSSLTHPSNPSEYTFEAVFRPIDQTGLAARQPSGLGWTSLSEVITFDNLTDDLWGQVIKPILCGLTKQEDVFLNKDLATCFEIDQTIKANKLAQVALKRIEGVSEDSECSSELSCYTPKLSLNLSDGVAAMPKTVVDAIGIALESDAISSFIHNTLWGKLISYSSTYMFDVIPLVDSAIVVPKTPGLRNTWCKKIQAVDYATVALDSAITKPMRGVAVASAGIAFETGIFGEPAFGGIGGCYAPDPAPDNGMIHVVRPPKWLENITISGHSPSRTTGLRLQDAISTATTPREVNSDDLRGNQDGRDRADIVSDAEELFDAYAHALYIANVLRTRAGQLSGKLRFDIAPGSVVEIEGTSGKFLVAGDNLAKTLYGTVSRVSVAINAETAKAGTAFRIRDIRTEQENQSDSTSAEAHPLYTTIFKGAPLVDDLLIPDNAEDCCLE